MKVPIPSSSVRAEVTAVRISSSYAFPEIVTVPRVVSSTLVTVEVELLVTDSVMLNASVYEAVTEIVVPTSDCPRVIVVPVAPVLHV